jgi:signal transduction histidine kinase
LPSRCWRSGRRRCGFASWRRRRRRQNYSGITKVRGNDEISALGSLFNETAADIRQRMVDAQDRGEALQRYVANVTVDVAAPLAALEQQLVDLERNARLSGDAEHELRHAVRAAHNLSSRLKNLAGVAHLRTITDTSPRQPVDLRALVERVVATRTPLAHAAQVTVELAPPDGTATVPADASLLEQAVANVIDNAILYNRPGGKVRVELRGYEHGGRFSLRVIDNGPGVGDEEFAGLTANKRFRGDEARTRRPGGRGLGLALAREVADRFGMQLDLRRPTAGGFEVEIATRTRA